MNKCLICGKYPSITSRWYQYDSGVQSLERVCVKCADLHTRLTAVK